MPQDGILNTIYIIVYFFWILSTAFSEKTAACRGILIYLHFRIAGIRY